MKKRFWRLGALLILSAGLVLCSCSLSPRGKGLGRTGYQIQDRTLLPAGRVAVLPIEVRLTYECLRSYEVGGGAKPSDREIYGTFFGPLYNATQSRGYTLLGVEEMQSLLERNNLRDPLQIYEQPPTKLGEILGVDGLVYFTVVDISDINKIRFDARFVETTHGLTLWCDRYHKSEKGGAKGAAVRGCQGCVAGIGVLFSAFTFGGSAMAAQAASEALGSASYRALSSMEGEVRLAVNDCFKGLPRTR
ncbi:MAG: hypothetical protein V2A71_03900 [Candidatus Eisenbacteria bacterium]